MPLFMGKFNMTVNVVDVSSSLIISSDKNVKYNLPCTVVSMRLPGNCPNWSGQNVFGLELFTEGLH